MKLLHQIQTITRIEAAYFARYPKLPLVLLIVMMIPALYALVFLSSVWDPIANTTSLKVALVNQDQGMNYRDRNFNIGHEVIAKLKESGRFGFQDIDDADEAKRLVREGGAAFALIIPPEFSSNAIPGILVGAGKPVVYVSEGNSYESGALAKHFGEILGQQINESLNEQRWSMVLTTAVGSQQSVDALRAGVAQLAKGAHELSEGAGKTASGSHVLVTGSDELSGGVRQLTNGMKQLDDGLRLIDSRRPSNNDLNQLKSGADKLAASHVELQHGLKELRHGSQQLEDGVHRFQEAANNSLWTPASLNDGLQQLGQGAGQLDSGVAAIQDAHDQLTDGAAQLDDGVGKLTNGMRAMGNGIRTMVNRLPLTTQLNQLNSGAMVLNSGTVRLEEATKSVAKGAQMLAVGIDQLQQSLPAKISRLDGSPEGLAHSVEPVVERVAPVKNNGSGFAPNIIPGALWLGAGVIAFLLHVRVLPMEAKGFARPAQLLGKMLLPAGMAMMQALGVMLAMCFVLQMDVANPLACLLTMLIASLSFLVIIFALTLAFGDAGRAFAMFLLAIQISSSSGVMPVELSGRVFMDISPWLPLTWIVKAFKASLFGAYDGVWLPPLTHAMFGAVVAFVLGCTVGKWRFASPASTRLPIEL